MKRNIVFILLLTLILAACGSSGQKTEQPASEPAAQ